MWFLRQLLRISWKEKRTDESVIELKINREFSKQSKEKEALFLWTSTQKQMLAEEKITVTGTVP